MRITSDRVLSISAMLIGLGSLFMIVCQIVLLREQQRASALPYLMIGLQATSEGSYVSAGERWRVSSDSVVPQPL